MTQASHNRLPNALISINALFIDEIHNINLLTDQQARNALLALLGGVFWFTAIRLLSENLAWRKNRFYLLALPIFALFFWYCSTQDKLQWSSVLPIFSAALTISIAPWLFRKKDNASFWFFNYQLLNALCFAILSALILCGGISLIFVSIDYLFEIYIGSVFYQDTWLFGMTLLAPIYFLAHIPKQFDYQRADCQFPKGIHFIFSYVLVPLSLIYMVILYAYFIKISLQWQLPRGHLGTMISAFGTIGIITHIAIYPIHDRSSKLISWFYRHFYLMMILPLLLLVFAISERIMQYGVTELRYLVVLCAILFAILIVSFIKNRQQFKLQQVVISLAVLTLFASFGPWGINQLPVNNQYSRLVTTLTQHGYLVDGKIQTSGQADFEIKKSISSMVDFLVEHNASAKLRPWFEDKQAFDKEMNCDDYQSCRYYNGKALVEMMGMRYISQWEGVNDFGLWTNISLADIDSPYMFRMFDVSKADFIIPIQWMSINETITTTTLDSNINKTEFSIMMNEENQLLITQKDGEEISFDIEVIAKQFPTDETVQVAAAEVEKLILKASGNTFTGTLYIEQLHLYYRNDEIQINSFVGDVLITMSP